MTLPATARPRLARKARLRLDRRTGGYLLLYPEAGLALNATGTAIVRLCDGERTIDAIAALLGQTFAPAAPASIEAEVRAFVEALAAKGLLQIQP